MIQLAAFSTAEGTCDALRRVQRRLGFVGKSRPVAVAVAASVSSSRQSRAAVGRKAPFEAPDGPDEAKSAAHEKNLAPFGLLDGSSER